MRFFHYLISILMTAVLLFLSWLLVAHIFEIACVTSPLKDFLFTKYGLLSLAAFFFFVPILFWLTAISAVSRKTRFLTFEGEDGKVNISVSAVNEFLARIGEEFASIIALRSKVFGTKNNAIVVELDLAVKAGVKLHELAHLLRQRVVESMRENLGVSEIASVHINFREIVDNSEKTASSEREEWQNTF